MGGYLPPRVSSCQHVSCIKWSGGAPTETNSIITQSLAAFVEEEDVVDELDGKSFAYTRTKGMDDTSSHEASVRGSLRCTEKTEHELKWSVHCNHARCGESYHEQRQEQYRTSAKLQICWNK
jgi:hypothetical protein